MVATVTLGAACAIGAGAAGAETVGTDIVAACEAPFCMPRVWVEPNWAVETVDFSTCEAASVRR